MRVNDLPIERKLVLLTLVTSSVALALAFAGFYGYEALNTRTNTVDKLSALASVVGSNSTAALAFNDQKDAGETLSALQSEERVVRACMYDADGRLFASYSRDANATCPTAQPELGDRPTEFVAVAEPIRLGGEELGTVLIDGDWGELEERLREYGIIAFFLLLFSGSVSVALAHRLQKLISQPLQELAGAAQAVGRSRSFNLRAEKHGNDECGRLVDAFNEMLSELEKRDGEVQSHRRELSDEVVARTTELRDANRDLKLEVAERKRAEAALRYQAMHDSLTGVPNRAFLMNELGQACEAYATDDANRFALVFVDLDGFKLINDSLGHECGDQVLQESAERLTRSVRHGDLVARLGGDEFAVLLRGLKNAAEARSTSERILQSFSAPFCVQESEVFVSASLGLVFGDDKTPETLLRDADAAMYSSKSAGKAGMRVFDEAMRSSAREELELRGALRRGIASDELFVEYQPIVAFDDGRQLGCEALVRWQRQDGQVFYPSRFIQTAEDSGLIGELGTWVLRRACVDFQRSGLVDQSAHFLSVNVSPLQFRKAEFIDEISRTLDDVRFPPHRLRLEITESSLIEDASEAERRLEQISRLGIQVAVDDFGTGYSSLKYLRRWPIHVLKVDRSFVSETPSHDASYEIVSAITSLARALKLTVTAEGVETEEQAELLGSIGCHEAQGYLFGRPAPIDAIREAALREASLDRSLRGLESAAKR